VCSRPGHERSESLEEGQRFEDDRAGASTSERERDGVTTKMSTRREGKVTYTVKIEATSPTK
jgi:hypothetical protein